MPTSLAELPHHVSRAIRATSDECPALYEAPHELSGRTFARGNPNATVVG